jgi:hypothetical protein
MFAARLERVRRRSRGYSAQKLRLCRTAAAGTSQLAAVTALTGRPAVAAVRLTVAAMEALEADIAAGMFEAEVALEWGGRGLTRLPDAIASLKHVQKLNLANNRLSEVPTALLELPCLRVLFFLNNDFAHIPSIIGRFRALYMLSFKR